MNNKKTIIMYIRECHGWQKVRVMGSRVIKLFTTQFERLNGYTRQQAQEWGI